MHAAPLVGEYWPSPHSVHSERSALGSVPALQIVQPCAQVVPGALMVLQARGVATVVSAKHQANGFRSTWSKQVSCNKAEHADPPIMSNWFAGLPSIQ